MRKNLNFYTSVFENAKDILKSKPKTYSCTGCFVRNRIIFKFLNKRRRNLQMPYPSQILHNVMQKLLQCVSSIWNFSLEAFGLGEPNHLEYLKNCAGLPLKFNYIFRFSFWRCLISKIFKFRLYLGNRKWRGNFKDVKLCSLLQQQNKRNTNVQCKWENEDR